MARGAARERAAAGALCGRGGGGAGPLPQLPELRRAGGALSHILRRVRPHPAAAAARTAQPLLPPLPVRSSPSHGAGVASPHMLTEAPPLRAL
jgi:hypothetical protein